MRGPALSLRYPAAADAPELFELARDPEVTRFFSWGPYRDVSEAAAWIGTLQARRADGEALELVIVDRADHVIGVTLLSELSRRDRRAIVGTWLGRPHWGTGANTEAKALVCALAFGPLGLERLGAYTDLRNARSQAALERLGFVREGVLRGFHRHHDLPRDVIVYALMRPEWQAGPLARIPAQITGSPPPAFAIE